MWAAGNIYNLKHGAAYPDSGKTSGYEYAYIGKPLSNAATAPSITVGSYAGTGAYEQQFKQF